MDKVTLTPGKLYAKLAEEFRRSRPLACHSCSMPMLFVIEAGDGRNANWLVDDRAASCEQCRPLVAEIVKRFASRFDVYDPMFTTRMQMPEGLPWHARKLQTIPPRGFLKAS
jgi:hypothetical protein